MRLGEWLKWYRAKHKMTMKELADTCGFSKAYIGMLEKGINPTTGKAVSPTLQTFEKIARGTGQDLDSLLKLLDEDQPVTVSKLKPLDSEEMKLIDNYRELNAEDKDFLWNIIQRLFTHNERVVVHDSLGKNNSSGNNYGIVGGNFSSNFMLK